MCRGDSAILTCQREAACASVAAGDESAVESLLPSPPSTATTVELELTLHSMIQVQLLCYCLAPDHIVLVRSSALMPWQWNICNIGLAKC